MIRLALVGGAYAYHGRAFSALINGVAHGESIPAGWPDFPRQVEGARIVSVLDENREAALQLAKTFDIEKVVSGPEKHCDNVDGVIITDDGSMLHQKRAHYFLERGIPTFIDKPLAPDIGEAEALVDLAQKHNAPFFSCSALRFADELTGFRDEMASLGEVELATTLCKGKLVYYGIHALELAYCVLGRGIRTAHNIGDEKRSLVKLTYQDGRVLMLLTAEKAGPLFQLNVVGTQGWRSLVVSDAQKFYTTLLRATVTMVQTKQAPVEADETLEIIRVLCAAKVSLATGKEINVG